MDWKTLAANVNHLATDFASQRSQRQLRTTLNLRDIAALADTGFPLVGVPEEQGGLWRDTATSTRAICELLRTLARGDASVALVSAMHPAVLSYWLTVADEEYDDDAWPRQRRRIFDTVKSGTWWGTITSEPGSGGDVARTKTVADPQGPPHEYLMTGEKHFGSGSGVTHFMVTTALPAGEEHPDWFFLDMRDVPWDGSQGVTLLAEWDGHGMKATQSHAFRFERFPATRIAWPGQLPQIAARTGAFINCLFTSVIVGIVDVAMAEAAERIDTANAGSYVQVEWARAQTEAWLIAQAYQGMLSAVEQQSDPRMDALRGKTAIAELSETLLSRLCRTVGGGTYARRSPLGHWHADVRALGFLRPPWPLAYQTLIDGFPSPDG